MFSIGDDGKRACIFRVTTSRLSATLVVSLLELKLMSITHFLAVAFSINVKLTGSQKNNKNSWLRFTVALGNSATRSRASPVKLKPCH